MSLVIDSASIDKLSISSVRALSKDCRDRTFTQIHATDGTDMRFIPEQLNCYSLHLM